MVDFYVFSYDCIRRSAQCVGAMHPNLESTHKGIWNRPGKDGRKGKRPTSLGQLSGKSKWEKPLADWIMGTGVGLVGQEMRDKEDFFCVTCFVSFCVCLLA
jgi:hypothetical protein